MAHIATVGPLFGKKFAEVGVGRHQDSLVITCRGEYLLIDVTREAAVRDMDHVVACFGEEWPKSSTDAFVEQELHAGVRSGTCRSLTAAAANSREARTSSVDSCG